MRAEDFQAQARMLPIQTLAAALGDTPILVLCPHPDDESLGCGGLILEACAQGIPLTVVFLSDGTGSHPSSAQYPKPVLRELREAEALAACKILGVAEDSIHFLRYPDRHVPSNGAQAEAAALKISDIMCQTGAAAIFVTWTGDPHCDHKAASAIAKEACRLRDGTRLFEFPVWGWILPVDAPCPDVEPRGFRLSVEKHLAKKRSAIFQHKSQTTSLIADDPHGFRLEPEMIDMLLQPYEVYLEATP
ncbi:MAG: PIG-L deacetylase family protein [Dongiaceae bacterium]